MIQAKGSCAFANHMKRKKCASQYSVQRTWKEREDVTMVDYDKRLKWVVEKQGKKSHFGDRGDMSLS